jgi:glycosidase
MSKWKAHPIIYEINTWAWLDDLSRKEGEKITLGNVPQKELKRFADYGFDALWLMGVWERSPKARLMDRSNSQLIEECKRLLPNFTPNDISGSPYAIRQYKIDANLGDEEKLAELRKRLKKLNLRLILDFVPNHLAIDHDWLTNYPQRLIEGKSSDSEKQPGNYFSFNGRIFAHGREGANPWPDTVQLDYRQSETRQAMSKILLDVAKHCDGVRCDMAMLVTHDVFLRTWGGGFDPPNTEFWPDTIVEVKKKYSDFLMLAEVYWHQEDAKLHRQGFDYTYDKWLYDYLKESNLPTLKYHLLADIKYQDRTARFIENHDEGRAVYIFGINRSQAAAVLTFALPGMRIFHDGQLEGNQRKLPVQIGRRNVEIPKQEIVQFYKKLLMALKDPIFHEGNWRLLEPQEEWEKEQCYKNFIAYLWEWGEERRLIVVNLSSDRTNCFIPLKIPALAGRTWELKDLLNKYHYKRNGDDLINGGLDLNLPAYGYHLFQLQPLS